MAEPASIKTFSNILYCLAAGLKFSVFSFTLMGQGYAGKKLTAPVMATLCSENDECLTVQRNHYEQCFNGSFKKAVAKGQRSKLYAYEFTACLNDTSGSNHFSATDVYEALKDSPETIIYSVLTNRS